MTCPSCGGELVPGADRCPVCDAALAPRVEGALAADPRLVTPPARDKAQPEPIRDIPGLRRQSKERSWRDEVQQRVRSRRQKRAESGLPLFDGLDGPVAEPAPATSPAPLEAPRPAAPADEPAAVSAPVSPLHELGEPVDPFPEKTWELSASREPRPVATEPGPAPEPGFEPERSLLPREDELADLPLGGALDAPPPAEAPPASDSLETLDRAIAARRRAAPSLDRTMPSLEMDGLGAGADEPEFELSAPAAEPLPLERPARPFERVQAAAVDLALFCLLAVVVVYFAGRAARVDLGALAASWPWLAAYLGLLAVFYAGYFTGTTGQTPGKLVTGLRVVGPAGRPPAYPKAAARAVAGLTGIAVAGLGCVPMAFDPAARTLHDRLFHTRVVRL